MTPKMMTLEMTNDDHVHTDNNIWNILWYGNDSDSRLHSEMMRCDIKMEEHNKLFMLREASKMIDDRDLQNPFHNKNPSSQKLQGSLLLSHHRS
jgi:hypothetical protein